MGHWDLNKIFHLQQVLGEYIIVLLETIQNIDYLNIAEEIL